MNGSTRKRCGPTDRVFGQQRSIIDQRFKLLTFERYPPALYDLVRDPGESTDIAGQRADKVEEMLAKLASELDRVQGVESRESQEPGSAGAGQLESEAALRELGYVE
jgi:hypothetical protein